MILNTSPLLTVHLLDYIESNWSSQNRWERKRRGCLYEKVKLTIRKTIVDEVDMVILPEEDRTLTVGREAIIVT